MAGKLATAYVDIIGRIKPFRDSLRQAKTEITSFSQRVKAKFAGLQQSIQRYAKYMAAAVGMAALLMAKRWVAAASMAEEKAAKFHAVFKEEAGAVLRWAKQYSKAVKRSQHDLVEWLGVLQDTFVPLGYSRKEAAEFSKTLVKLAIDLASFQDKAESDVINDLQSALTGMTRTMYKYGVIIHDSDVKQKAYAMGLAKVGKEVSSRSKVEARLQLIMEGTTDAHGDAIRTADSFANTMRDLKSAIKDTSVVLGGFVKEGLKPAVSWAAKMIRNMHELAEALFEPDLTPLERQQNKQLAYQWKYRTYLDTRKDGLRGEPYLPGYLTAEEVERKTRRDKARGLAAEIAMSKQLERLVPEKERKELAYVKQQLETRKQLFDQLRKWGVEEENIDAHKKEFAEYFATQYRDELEAEEKAAEARTEVGANMREMAKAWMTPLQQEIAALYERAEQYRKLGIEEWHVKEWVEKKKLDAAKRNIEAEMGMVNELGEAIRETWEPQWMGGEDVWKRAMVKARQVTYQTTPAQSQTDIMRKMVEIQQRTFEAIQKVAMATEGSLQLEEGTRRQLFMGR